MWFHRPIRTFPTRAVRMAMLAWQTVPNRRFYRTNRPTCCCWTTTTMWFARTNRLITVRMWTDWRLCSTRPRRSSHPPADKSQVPRRLRTFSHHRMPRRPARPFIRAPMVNNRVRLVVRRRVCSLPHRHPFRPNTSHASLICNRTGIVVQRPRLAIRTKLRPDWIMVNHPLAQMARTRRRVEVAVCPHNALLYPPRHMFCNRWTISPDPRNNRPHRTTIKPSYWAKTIWLDFKVPKRCLLAWKKSRPSSVKNWTNFRRVGVVCRPRWLPRQQWTIRWWTRTRHLWAHRLARTALMSTASKPQVNTRINTIISQHWCNRL